MARYRTYDIDLQLLLETHPLAEVAGIPSVPQSFEAFGKQPTNIVELLGRPDWRGRGYVTLIELEDAAPRYYLALLPEGKTSVDAYPLNYLRLRVETFGRTAGAFDAEELLAGEPWSVPDGGRESSIRPSQRT